MQPGTEGERHQLVIRRVILDRVDAVAETVVCPELRGVTVGLRSERLHTLAAYEVPDRARAIGDPPATLARHGLLKDPIAGPGVEIYEGRRLICRPWGDFQARVVHGFGWASRPSVNAERFPTAASVWHPARSPFDRICSARGSSHRNPGDNPPRARNRRPARWASRYFPETAWSSSAMSWTLRRDAFAPRCERKRR